LSGGAELCDDEVRELIDKAAKIIANRTAQLFER
jgi:hypothetical protein